ncbi:UNVERIFIED_CONTAM: hypothetical protein Sradi_6179600 [Sesamum radiatum]|uniref:Zinc knuckle CX2CX4HX4C domain-containing protein n=1 Tax=Sesamum radiatum TaxID=300843 RepID=A0AAW2KB83_SESRA
MDSGFRVASSVPRRELLCSKQPKFEALVSSIRSMLNPVKGLEMRNLEEGRFLIRFHHIIDRNRALEGCPWSFEKNTLILSGVGPNENPMNVDLNWCDFFVHVHDLPLSKMTHDIAALIVNKIGRFRDMEANDSGKSWGASIRIRVAIDVSLPLFRVLRVGQAMGEELVVSFTYERLQNFCYLCGTLGRISKYCEKGFADGFVDSGDNTPYGPWLRASPRPWGNRSRNYVGSTSSDQRRSPPRTHGQGERDSFGVPSKRERGIQVLIEDERSDTQNGVMNGNEEIRSQ